MTVVTPDVLTTAEAAAAIGIKPGSFRRYLTRGNAPTPDGYLGRTPYWHRATIDAWLAARPGQGKGGGRPRKADTPGS